MATVKKAAAKKAVAKKTVEVETRHVGISLLRLPILRCVYNDILAVSQPKLGRAYTAVAL